MQILQGTVSWDGSFFLVHAINNCLHVVQVQTFVCVLAVVAITLAAIVHDRKAMERRLNEMNSTLESQVVSLHTYLLKFFYSCRWWMAEANGSRNPINLPNSVFMLIAWVVMCIKTLIDSSNRPHRCVRELCNWNGPTDRYKCRKLLLKRLAEPNLSFWQTWVMKSGHSSFYLSLRMNFTDQHMQ